MWYVIQVTACREMDMVHRCRQILREGEEVFTMLTERMERRDGKWQPHSFVTFQKYIFVDTDDPENFKIRLHSIDGLTKMLGAGDEIVPIRSDEEEFLRRVGGPEHVIGRSYVYSEGDKVVITTGPLAGMEGRIRWMDRRQKLIGVAVSFLDKETVIKFGAEYIRKD